jgi:AhpD family alkylhydroperoxidase
VAIVSVPLDFEITMATGCRWCAGMHHATLPLR